MFIPMIEFQASTFQKSTGLNSYAIEKDLPFYEQISNRIKDYQTRLSIGKSASEEHL